MKKFLFMIFLVVFSLSFGQKTLDAKIITRENDTLNVKIKVSTNMFDPNLLYVTSFSKKVTIIGEDNKRTKIEASKIKELSLTDFNGKERFFINNSEDQEFLTEQMFKGKVLDWYRNYNSSSGGENASDFLFNKITQKGITVGYFTGLPKKKLKEFLNDVPEIDNFIDEAKSSAFSAELTSSMREIIQKYEDLKSK